MVKILIENVKKWHYDTEVTIYVTILSNKKSTDINI
jgi:hypothetical protein